MSWVQALLIGGCFGGDGVFGDGHAADPSEVARLLARVARAEAQYVLEVTDHAYELTRAPSNGRRVQDIGVELPKL